MMTKHLYDILRILLRKNPKSTVKRQKSKLLIYDVYLKKYVKADELLIPSPTKDRSEGLESWKKSKDYMLFDLLLKKLINPKLDLLTPPGVNSKKWDTSTQGYRYASTIKDFWERGTEGKTRHVPAITEKSDGGSENEQQEVGWAGQALRKPLSNPRPEQSNKRLKFGLGRDSENNRKNTKTSSAKERTKTKKNAAIYETSLSEIKPEKKSLSAKSLQLQKSVVLKNKSNIKLLDKKSNIKYNIFYKAINALTIAEPNIFVQHHKNEVIEGNPLKKEKETLFEKIRSQMFSLLKYEGIEDKKNSSRSPTLSGKNNLTKDKRTISGEKNYESRKNITESNTTKIKSPTDYKNTADLTNSINEKSVIKNMSFEGESDKRFDQFQAQNNFTSPKNDKAMVRNNSSSNKLANNVKENLELKQTLNSKSQFNKNKMPENKQGKSAEEHKKVTRNLTGSISENPRVKNDKLGGELEKNLRMHNEKITGENNSKSKPYTDKNNNSEDKPVISDEDKKITSSEIEKNSIRNNTSVRKSSNNAKENFASKKTTFASKRGIDKMSGSEIKLEKYNERPSLTDSTDKNIIVRNSTSDSTLLNNVKKVNRTVIGSQGTKITTEINKTERKVEKEQQQEKDIPNLTNSNNVEKTPKDATGVYKKMEKINEVTENSKGSLVKKHKDNEKVLNSNNDLQTSTNKTNMNTNNKQNNSQINYNQTLNGNGNESKLTSNKKTIPVEANVSQPPKDSGKINLADSQRVIPQEKNQSVQVNTLNKPNLFNLIFSPAKLKFNKPTLSTNNTDLGSKYGNNFTNTMTTQPHHVRSSERKTAEKFTSSSNFRPRAQVNSVNKNSEVPKGSTSSLTNIKISGTVDSSVDTANQPEKQKGDLTSKTLKPTRLISKKTEKVTPQTTNTGKMSASSGMEKTVDKTKESIEPKMAVVSKVDESKPEGNTNKSHTIEKKTTEKLHAISAQGKYVDDLALDGELKKYNINNYKGFKIMNSHSNVHISNKNSSETSKTLKKNLARSSSQKMEELGKPNDKQKSNELRTSNLPKSVGQEVKNNVSVQNKTLIHKKKENDKIIKNCTVVKNANVKFDQEKIENNLPVNKDGVSKGKEVKKEVSNHYLPNKNVLGKFEVSAVTEPENANITKQDEPETSPTKSDLKDTTTEATSPQLPLQHKEKKSATVGHKPNHRTRYHVQRRKLLKPITTFKYSKKKTRLIKKEPENTRIINHIKKKKTNNNLILHEEQLNKEARSVKNSKSENKASLSVSKTRLNKITQRSTSIPEKDSAYGNKQENEKQISKTKSEKTLLPSNKIQSQVKSVLKRGAQIETSKNITMPKLNPKIPSSKSSKIKEPKSEDNKSLKEHSKTGDKALKNGNKRIDVQRLDDKNLKTEDNINKGKIVNKQSLPSMNQSTVISRLKKTQSNTSNKKTLQRKNSKQRNSIPEKTYSSENYGYLSKQPVAKKTPQKELSIDTNYKQVNQVKNNKNEVEKQAEDSIKVGTSEQYFDSKDDSFLKKNRIMSNRIKNTSRSKSENEVKKLKKKSNLENNESKGITNSLASTNIAKAKLTNSQNYEVHRKRKNSLHSLRSEQSNNINALDKSTTSHINKYKLSKQDKIQKTEVQTKQSLKNVIRNIKNNNEECKKETIVPLKNVIFNSSRAFKVKQCKAFQPAAGKRQNKPIHPASPSKTEDQDRVIINQQSLNDKLKNKEHSQNDFPITKDSNIRNENGDINDNKSIQNNSFTNSKIKKKVAKKSITLEKYLRENLKSRGNKITTKKVKKETYQIKDLNSNGKDNSTYATKKYNKELLVEDKNKATMNKTQSSSLNKTSYKQQPKDGGNKSKEIHVNQTEVNIKTASYKRPRTESKTKKIVNSADQTAHTSRTAEKSVSRGRMGEELENNLKTTNTVKLLHQDTSVENRNIQGIHFPKDSHREQQSCKVNTPKKPHIRERSVSTSKITNKQSSDVHASEKVSFKNNSVNEKCSKESEMHTKSADSKEPSKVQGNDRYGGVENRNEKIKMKEGILNDKNQKGSNSSSEGKSERKTPIKKFNVEKHTTTLQDNLEKEKQKLETISINKKVSEGNQNKDTTFKSQTLRKLDTPNLPSRSSDRNNKGKKIDQVSVMDIKGLIDKKIVKNTNNFRTETTNQLKRLKETKDMSIAYSDKVNSKQGIKINEENKTKDNIKNEKQSISHLQDEIKPSKRVSTPNYKNIKTKPLGTNTAIMNPRNKGKNNKTDKSSLMKDKGFDATPEIRRKLSSLSKNSSCTELDIKETHFGLPKTDNILQEQVQLEKDCIVNSKRHTILEDLAKITCFDNNKNQIYIKKQANNNTECEVKKESNAEDEKSVSEITHTNLKEPLQKDLRLLLENIKIKSNRKCSGENNMQENKYSTADKAENKRTIFQNVKDEMQNKDSRPTDTLVLTDKKDNPETQMTLKNSEEDRALRQLSTRFLSQTKKEVKNKIDSVMELKNTFHSVQQGQKTEDNKSLKGISNKGPVKSHTTINSLNQKDLSNLIRCIDLKRIKSEVENEAAGIPPQCQKTEKYTPTDIGRKTLESLKNNKTAKMNRNTRSVK